MTLALMMIAIEHEFNYPTPATVLDGMLNPYTNDVMVTDVGAATIKWRDEVLEELKDTEDNLEAYLR